MIGDIKTVFWKEWQEIMVWGGARGKLGILLLAGVFGIFLPLQSGRGWVETPAVLIYWTWVPLFLVSSVIADAFAGERERHTLETLLASRLSDRAILLGKFAAAVAYGVSIAWLCLLLGLVIVNLVHGAGELLLYPLNVAVGIVALTLLGAGLSAGAGVLVSLRASTVRQAQQTLSIAIMLLLFVPVFGFQALPDEWKMHLAEQFVNLSVTRVIVIASLLLVALNVGLLAAATGRFRRARLILD